MRNIADFLLDPVRMINDIRAEASPGLGIWGPALNLPQLLGGLYFIQKAEGWLILVFWLPILPMLYQSAFRQTELNLFSG